MPELEAGRVLDALVAEKVMGWVWVKSPVRKAVAILVEAPFSKSEWQALDGTEERYTNFHNVAHYSTEIAAAWEVVNKLGPYFRLTRGGYMSGDSLDQLKCIDDYEAEFAPKSPDEPFVYGRADTAPLAICLAALQTVQS